MAARKKIRKVQKPAVESKHASAIRKAVRKRKTSPADPIAIAEKMIADRGHNRTSIYDVEPIAGWVVALTELKITKPRELTWKMIGQSLTEAAEQAKLEIPAGGYAAGSITSWLERRHPKLYERAKRNS